MSRLTPLAFAALATLHERPMHPYEMYQLLTSRGEHRVVKVRPGSLYHAIARLADDGLVRATGTEREGNRPERTTYELTDAGRATLREELVEAIAEPAEEYPQFPLLLSELGTLPAAHAAELLRARADALSAELAHLDGSHAAVRARAVPEAYWLDLTYLRAMLSAELEWIRATVARIQADEIVWPDPDAAPAGKPAAEHGAAPGAATSTPHTASPANDRTLRTQPTKDLVP